MGKIRGLKMDNEIEMPATVAAFLQQPAVRAAVEALLKVEPDVLPPGLEFEELDTYYRARGGAELTRHDMAHLLRQLWKRIWGRQIGPDWRPAPLEEMVEEEYAVTLDQIWDEKSFTVYHYQTPYVLYTDVKVEPHALSIAFLVEDGEEESVPDLDVLSPFRWRDDEDWRGWHVTVLECDPKGSLPDLSPLLEAAAHAYSVAEAAVAAGTTSG